MFSGNPERRFCSEYNHMSYGVKEFYSHRNTHLFAARHYGEWLMQRKDGN
jgi:hypothetical protein